MVKKIRLLTIALTILAAPCLTYAQQPLKKIPRIGFLTVGRVNPGTGLTALTDKTTGAVFREGLHDLGWVEGKSIVIEYRSAHGNEDRLPVLAAELLRTNVDIIVATNSRVTRAVRQLTENIPIVNTFIGPRDTLINLAHPTRNVTGLYFMSPRLGGKRLELLKEIIPRISRVAVLANVDTVDRDPSIKEINIVARSLRVQLQMLNVKKPEEIENAFASVIRGKSGALTVQTQGMFVLYRGRIIELAAKNRLPVMYPDSRFTNSGGLMSYGANNAEMYRRAAYFVDRILKDAKVADLPVEQPTKFELVVNLKTAKQLGLTIPPKVLTWVDRVID